MKIQEAIQERLGNKIIVWHQVNPRRQYFTIKKEDIFEVVKFLFRDLHLRFSIASGVDTPEGIEILYHFSDDKDGIFYSARVLIEDKKSPAIDSITPLFPGGEWIEREIWEMLGVNFVGHPNLKRLLLADDWPEGEYPLRRSS